MGSKQFKRKPELLRLLSISLAFFFILGTISHGIAKEPVPLKVSLLPYISYAPIFIALEEGYFAEQELKVELIRFRGGGQTIPVLARGDLDVGSDITGSNLFSAIARGLKLKIVADKGHLDAGCNYHAMMVRKDLYDNGKVRNVEQLRGRKIALESIPSMGYVYEKMLSKGNLTLNDIEIVRMPIPARVEALATGAIDAASAAEPMVTQLKTLRYAVTLAKFEDSVPNYQLASILFGPNLIERNPNLGRRFMIAYLKGVRQYNKGKTDRNIEIFQKYTMLDTNILKKICLPSIYTDGHVNRKSIFTCQDWAYKKGFIDTKVTEDQLIDMSFAVYANMILERTERN